LLVLVGKLTSVPGVGQGNETILKRVDGIEHIAICVVADVAGKRELNASEVKPVNLQAQAL
jgi:hypothetical protein